MKKIFSEDIRTKYSRYPSSHNKHIIEILINESDEIKKSTFTKIFNLTFLDCLNHFRGGISLKHSIISTFFFDKNILDDFQGMNQINNYIKEGKIDNIDEEYCTIFNYFMNNFENIIMAKKTRKRKSKNDI